MSFSAMHRRNGGNFRPSRGGAAVPIGHVKGWSLLLPIGSAKLKNLSTISNVRNGDYGISISDRLRVDLTNPGWIGIAPTSRTGLRSAEPTLAATSWTKFPPELSPMRKTLLKSLYSSSHGSKTSPLATD
ncbi:putative carboxylesterase [Trifolium repens]|nr:putative carboxylesterase [Trifolium repens]